MNPLTVQQQEVWEELNYWYAMLIAAHAVIASGVKDGDYWCGLCNLSQSVGGNFTRFLPARAYDYAPIKSHGYWWPVFDWAPRVAFIKHMIHLCEAELRTL